MVHARASPHSLKLSLVTNEVTRVIRYHYYLMSMKR